MGWPSSILIAVLTGAAGTVLAGLIAALSVEWYHISGREGESGYFVVAIAFLGLIAGLVIGLVASRVVAGRNRPGFLKALGISFGIVLAIGSVGGGLARALADVPPEIDGQSLMLAVEVRWPAGHVRSPADEPGQGFLTLGSVTRASHLQRASVRGPLWKEDARLVDGRWVAPGAVEVFTSRGIRSLDISIDTTSLGGFIVPLPSHPGRGDLEWSEWLPESLNGAPWPADRFSYRYRVQRASQPIRAETIGQFEVSTIASQFYDAVFSGRTILSANASFTVRYRGRAVTIPSESAGAGTSAEHIDAVTAVPGTEPGLLVHVADPASSGHTDLLIPAGDRVRIEPIAKYQASAVLLTSDTTRFRKGSHHETPRGWIDRASFAEPGVFLVGSAMVDARGSMTVRHFSAKADVTSIPAVPPLGLSPDGRSFVCFSYDGTSADRMVVDVTDVVANTAYTLPVDLTRMRIPRLDALDPAWLLHHFAWERQPDGVDRLVERKDFVPLPWHGKLSGEGNAENYRLEPAGEPLRNALVEFLVREFKAERLSTEPGAYEHQLRIEGRVVKVAASSNFNYVLVSVEPGPNSSSLLAAMAERFDADLATGKYDALFGTKPNS
jgi:hypothetical protein